MSAERVLAGQRERAAEEAICSECEHGTHLAGDCKQAMLIPGIPGPVGCGCGDEDGEVRRCPACGEECDRAEGVCECAAECPIPAAASNR